MNRFIFSYDIHGPHRDFKDRCIKNGFFDALFLADGRKWMLPNTTLIGWFADRAAAERMFDALAAQSGVNITKVLIAACDVPLLGSDELAL
ncbi:hypothetical protein D7X96_15940 [Corallococcus interemptor]|uniref:DUF3303 domain-containing protein n=1 Tax=Corallococcus interemptor TaxID=2316720 RepID=A0A3A8QQ74_9BACT|nr:hypothetical protein [Corallococcus interemptor]RKH69070.1 hypothetical protein D7X96_15940 [Corallococcus interemptor]